MLFVQGTRDPFGTPLQLEPVLSTLETPARIHKVMGGDHSFALPRKWTGAEPQLFDAAARAIAEWVTTEILNAVGGDARDAAIAIATMTRLAYLVHVYTATGAVWALLSLIAIDAFDYRLALIWLVVATFVDATDGWLARWARVDRHATLINGARLDDIVDYATYVLAPGVLLLHAGRLPEGWIGVTVVCGMLLASALGFTRQDAKTDRSLLHRLPVLLEHRRPLRAGGGHSARAVTAIVVAGLSVMVLVPIRFVYPSRTKTWQALTVTGCALWGVQVLLMIWWMPDVPAWLLWTSSDLPGLLRRPVARAQRATAGDDAPLKAVERERRVERRAGASHQPPADMAGN